MSSFANSEAIGSHNALSIKRNPKFAESTVSVIGITNNIYGRPQYFLVDSDQGQNPGLKFPGLKFVSPITRTKTLEDAAYERFEEQTGLNISKRLGLRRIIPAITRHQPSQWVFQNIFLALVNDVNERRKTDGRNVYLADIGQGVIQKEESVYPLGISDKKVPLNWITQDNMLIARTASDILGHFDWNDHTTSWYKEIPCIGAQLEGLEDNTGLGCGLAVASMMLIYQPNIREREKIILVKKRSDIFPGYPGGKIETPGTSEYNPISCCVKEGKEELGFDIDPLALIGVANTALQRPINGEPRGFYNSIINYAFVARPRDNAEVKEALSNPRNFLEKEMEGYVVEDLDQHRDRIMRKELRMPDNISIGEQFFRSSPGDKPNLYQILF